MGTHRPEDTSLCYRSGLPYARVGTMPSADCCWTVREALASLSQFPWHATSQGVPQLSRGKSQHLLRIDAGFTKPSLSGWRTWWLRAHSSRNRSRGGQARRPAKNELSRIEGVRGKGLEPGGNVPYQHTSCCEVLIFPGFWIPTL